MAKTGKFKLDKRYLIVGLLLLIGLYIILPQFGDFKTSLNKLSDPNLYWTAIAIIFTFLTYLSASLTYYFLAFKKLSLALTMLAQVAVMFINRLLPGGVGALGANYLYLKNQKHTSAQAATVVAINNFLGFLGHNLLFWGLVLFTSYSAISSSDDGSNKSESILLLILVLSLVGLAAAFIFGKQKILKELNDIKKQIFDYRHRPFNLVKALISTMTLTIFNVMCLYACAQALGVELNFAITFLIFTFGLTAGTLTPTPGGLGGFEAGLVAGFMAYDINSSTALAVALLYRLISYWLPLIIGAGTFIIAQKIKLFG